MAHPAYRGERWAAAKRATLERDGWRCQLCGQPIDPHARPNTADAGTADHVIPVDAGGPWWELSNLRAAHLGCNRTRANTTRHRSARVRYAPPRQW